MAGQMEIFTGAILLAEFFSAVPSDLEYRIYGVNLAPADDILIDRTEPFDLSQPVLSTQLRGSYENNFEAFDDGPENLGAGGETQRPHRTAFDCFTTFYLS